VGDSLLDELDTDEYAAQLMRGTLANRGFNDLIIGMKGATEEQAMLLEAKYNQRQRGFQNSGKAMIIDAEKLDVNTVTTNLSELRLIELRDFERKIVAETFGIPPELLGASSTNYRAANTAETIFAKYVLIPRLVSMQLDLQWNVLPEFDPRGEYLVMFESPVPSDREHELAVMKAQPAAFTLNEWRSAAGHGEEAWGEERGQPAKAPQSSGDAPAGKELARAARPFVREGAAITQAEIQALVRSIDSTELVDKLSDGWRIQMEPIAVAQWAELGVSADLGLINPVISDHLAEFGSRWIAGVDQTTKDLVGQTLAEGVAKGEGTQELAKRVRQQMGYLQADGYRSTLIARTEVVRSANIGRQISWDASGLVLRKRYVSALTSTTRESHAALHNVEVPLTGTWTYDGALEPFIVDTISSPGGSTEAAHACSCLCSMVAFDPEHGKAVVPYGSEAHGLVAKAFEQEVSAWEDATIAVMDPFYGNMADDLVRQLERLA